MKLDVEIRAALTQIDFVTRYEGLSHQFDVEKLPMSERLVYLDGEEVFEMLQSLGYVPRFNRREKFYSIREERVGAFTFNLHIGLEDGRVELIWAVREGGVVRLGIPWGLCARMLQPDRKRIRMPAFGTYEDLEEILKLAFHLYEDLKTALTKDCQHAEKMEI